MESPVFSVLVLIAFGLLVTVSGGIVYLTLSDWRDRRRQDRDKRGERIDDRKTPPASRKVSKGMKVK